MVCKLPITVYNKIRVGLAREWPILYVRNKKYVLMLKFNDILNIFGKVLDFL